jgi:hypothetical protein
MESNDDDQKEILEKIEFHKQQIKILRKNLEKKKYLKKREKCP